MMIATHKQGDGEFEDETYESVDNDDEGGVAVE
jgi:hypothetical protein